MTTVRDAIRENSRLARMRQGQDAPEYVDIPSMPDVRAWQVPLAEYEAAQGLIFAAALDVPENAVGMQARHRAAMTSDVWYSLREIGNVDVKVFASIEEMTSPGALLSSDVDYLADNLMLLMSYASPALDGIGSEELKMLTKAFGETDLSGLTGKRWAAVKLACKNLFPELLEAWSSGSTSIDSSTQRSESAEST